jgi:hypothetical protein
VQSYKASHVGTKYGAMCGDKISVEPRKVATKVWSVSRSGMLHKVVKSLEPCNVAKKCGAQKSGNKSVECGVWLEVV